ncbi:MAG: glycosyltransferase [Nitrospirae bacterium]|nr:glycosyltransferase [Nitrospirota bacterium]
MYDEVVKIGLHPEIIKMEGSFNIKYLFKLIKFIRRNKIDLIHSHLLGSNVYCSIAGICCHVPVISTFHGTVDSNLYGRMLNLKFRLINAGSKYIVFVSENLKKYYLNFTPLSKQKSITIYNGVDFDRFLNIENRCLRKELGYNDNEVLIGSIGNIRDAKGYDILLQAASVVIKTFPLCKFIIAGEGCGELYQNLLALRKMFGLEKYVTFLGFRHDIENMLNSIDLFVLPSITEGFSIAAVEAMAASKPVIATKCGGPEEIAIDGETGFLIPPKDPEALANGILNLLRNRRLAKKMGELGRKRVAENFTLEAMIHNYQELYKNCLLMNN